MSIDFVQFFYAKFTGVECVKITTTRIIVLFLLRVAIWHWIRNTGKIKS